MAQEQQNNSAITDGVVGENQVTGQDEARIIDRARDHQARWIREAIEISKVKRQEMIKNAKTYTLSHLYDTLFSAAMIPGGELSVW